MSVHKNFHLFGCIDRLTYVGWVCYRYIIHRVLIKATFVITVFRLVFYVYSAILVNKDDHLYIS